jgi:glycosyltransferase involved in cell wall biosynthesis
MKFSIIVPAYNASEFIERCLKSLLNQDFSKDEFEVIVVDDASTDTQNEIIEKYIGNYYNLRLVRHSVNKRQGGARNTGFDYSKGAYIIFVDADDYWIRKDVLCCFDKLISEYKCDIIEALSSKTLCEDSSSRKIDSPCNIVRLLSRDDYFSLYDRHPYIWLDCYSRTIFEGIRFRENVAFEDGDWKAKVFFNARNILMIEFDYYCYYNNPTSTIRKGNIDVFYANIDVNNELLEFYLANLQGNPLKSSLNKLKRNIFSYLKISKEYSIQESANVLRYASNTPLMNTSLYRLNSKEKMVFLVMKYAPFIIVMIIKWGVLLRRKIRKIFKLLAVNSVSKGFLGA